MFTAGSYVTSVCLVPPRANQDLMTHFFHKNLPRRVSSCLTEIKRFSRTKGVQLITESKGRRGWKNMVNCWLYTSNRPKGQRMNRQKKHIANCFLFQSMRGLALKYNVKV